MTSGEVSHQPKLTVRRLAWAGIEVTLGSTRVLIDALENAAHLEPVLGKPKAPMPPVDAPDGTHALITHIHPDHYDVELLRRIVNTGTVGCYNSLVSDLAGDGVSAIGRELGEARQLGDLTLTPVPSLDWRGEDQVAWVIEGGGRKIIHCGDTMWHGSWWQIAEDHGPFDIAFLPVNGVIARFQGFEANVPVTMSPEQAVEAAVALRARSVCAIHYYLFNNPPIYVEQTDIESRFTTAGKGRNLPVVIAQIGELVDFPQ